MYDHEKGTMVFVTPTHFTINNLHPDERKT